MQSLGLQKEAGRKGEGAKAQGEKMAGFAYRQKGSQDEGRKMGGNAFVKAHKTSQFVSIDMKSITSKLHKPAKRLEGLQQLKMAFEKIANSNGMAGNVKLVLDEGSVPSLSVHLGKRQFARIIGEKNRVVVCEGKTACDTGNFDLLQRAILSRILLRFAEKVGAKADVFNR
jgi:hypothetical protein